MRLRAKLLHRLQQIAHLQLERSVCVSNGQGEAKKLTASLAHARAIINDLVTMGVDKLRGQCQRHRSTYEGRNFILHGLLFVIDVRGRKEK